MIKHTLSLANTIAVGLLLSLTGLQAQSSADNSTQPPPTPKQISSAPVHPLNPALPTLFIVGDSTARNQADLGWGDHLAHYFDTRRINIANRAVAGRSTRTYQNEGIWDKVLDDIKPEDTVLIQLGHNDGGDLDGAKPRGTLKGTGNESKDVTLPDGRVETVHTYGWYLCKFIADTRSKQASPILLSLTTRNIWKIGPDGKQHIERDMGYDVLIKYIATEQKVPFADMAVIEADHLESLGPGKTALFFPKDHTHTSAEGAEFNAQAVVRSLLAIHSPVASYLIPSSN